MFDLLFPNLNLGALCLLMASMTLLTLALLCESIPGVGWTVYPPLSDSTAHPYSTLDIAIFALHINGLSSIGGSINVLTTLL